MVPKKQYPRLSCGIYMHVHTSVCPRKHAQIKNMNEETMENFPSEEPLWGFLALI